MLSSMAATRHMWILSVCIGWQSSRESVFVCSGCSNRILQTRLLVSHRTVFLPGLERGSPRPGHQKTRCLVRAPALSTTPLCPLAYSARRLSLTFRLYLLLLTVCLLPPERKLPAGKFSSCFVTAGSQSQEGAQHHAEFW